MTKQLNDGSSAIVLEIKDLSEVVKEIHDQSVHMEEAYRLTVVNKENTFTVVITGQTDAGVFYGLQSLLNLLEGSDNGRRMPMVHVVDAPRFQYRGLMVDVSRNFVTKDVILQTLDVMAMYKMNKFHFHLTDDQGWRFEVPWLPELVEVGYNRKT